MTNAPSTAEIDRKLGIQIARASEEFVAAQQINSRFDFVTAFVQGIDLAISKSPVRPTTFAVVLNASGHAEVFFIRRNFGMSELLTVLPVNAETSATLIWHVITKKEDRRLAGRRTAMWNDKDGNAFCFGEVGGRFKLISASGPGFEMAA